VAIGAFCSSTYDVTFPLFAKVKVNGDSAHPLWQHLKKSAPGILGSEAIKWNFTKFLVDGKGQVVGRYASTTKPTELSGDIERLLQSMTPST
jgi:glutathione peroxidase